MTKNKNFSAIKVNDEYLILIARKSVFLSNELEFKRLSDIKTFNILKKSYKECTLSLSNKTLLALRSEIKKTHE